MCFDARTADSHFPGIGRYAFNLARALAAELEVGEHLHILRPASGVSADRLAALADDTTSSEAVDFSPLSLRQQWMVPRAIRSSRADLYHSPYVGMPLRPGAPTVVTIHDLIPLRASDSISAARRMAVRALLHRAAATADTIIAPSEQTAEELRDILRVPADKICIIHYAADPDLAARAAAAPAIRDGRYALCVGAARPHKNHLRLVEAWSAVDPEFGLTFAGPGQTADSAAAGKARALGTLGRILFAGEVHDDELAALYRGAEMVLLPSEIEGFGLPALEAMACGAPLACADTPALREVAGNAAAFFPARDVDAIAATVNELAGSESRREQLRSAGRERARAFSWSKTARETLEVYRSMIAKR